MTQQLKTMRHELLWGDWPFHQQLLQSRDVAGDVGVDIEEEKQRELPIAVMANARRIQESLRVLEELAKVPEVRLPLDPEKYKQARFNLYSIEQKLLSKLQRQDKRKHISGLYVIIDPQWLKGRRHIEVAHQAIQGGAKTIQLRSKPTNKKELLSIAEQLKRLCSENDVLFIVNDYLDLALAAEADGLHLEFDNLPVKIGRKLLPMDKILGVSVATVEQAVAAEAAEADYIALGSIYPTSPPEEVEIVGVERLSQMRRAITLPLVAVGGITRDNVAAVIAAGADSVAVTGTILSAADVAAAARQIADQFCVQSE